MKILLTFVVLSFQFNATISQSLSKNSSYHSWFFPSLDWNDNARIGGCDFLKMITVDEVRQKTEERFWSKINFGKIGACWEWKSGLDGRGYGHYAYWNNDIGNGKKISTAASRYMGRRVLADFKEHLQVCHKCDNPKCCNPNHLFMGTRKDNARDMVNKGRIKDRRGCNNGNSKIKEIDIPIIFDRIISGETMKSIAESYGTSISPISYIRTRKTWAHIEIPKNILKLVEWKRTDKRPKLTKKCAEQAIKILNQ